MEEENTTPQFNPIFTILQCLLVLEYLMTSFPVNFSLGNPWKQIIMRRLKYLVLSEKETSA